ncbi:MAG: RNA polymerase sigma factor [Verrucomicrobiota bacterium]
MPAEDDDRQLMARLANGETAVMRQLIQRWERPLLSFTLRYVQNRTVAEELTQETFVRLYRARERFDPAYPLASWIFRIAANLCRNHHRWQRRHHTTSLDALSPTGERIPLPASDAPHPANQLVAEEKLHWLRENIREMPHALKTALLLHYYEGLSYHEIARVLGCGERGVESRLYRARKWLQQRLARAERAALPGTGLPPHVPVNKQPI